VTCNGVPLTASRWLSDGDDVGVGRYRLRCESTGNAVRLALIPPATQGDADPVAGVSPPSPIVAPGQVITPADFKPRWQSPPRGSRFRVRPRSMMLMAAIALLATGAWFVLTARAVRVETIPTAEQLADTQDRRQLPPASRELYGGGQAHGLPHPLSPPRGRCRHPIGGLLHPRAPRRPTHHHLAARGRRGNHHRRHRVRHHTGR